MVHRILICLIGLVFILSAAGPMLAAQPPQQPVASPAAAVSTNTAVGQAFHASPVMFIQNMGQWDLGARFQVRGGNGTMWLAEDAICITVVKRSADNSRSNVDTFERFDPERENVKREDVQRQAANIRLSFPGANAHPRIEPFDRLDTVVSYFIGNDPDKWRPDVPVWGGVRYVDLYPGVDLEIASEGGQMVQRLEARPGADLSAVRLRVEGADAVAVAGDALRLSTAAGEFTLPLLRVDGAQLADLKVQSHGTQAFDVAAPFALANSDPASRDASSRQSAIENLHSPADNPADLLYGTFLGGSGEDYVYGSIAVDAVGSAYVTGHTSSSDFPATPGAFDTSLNGVVDAFVVKLNPAGSGLAYATFLGGSGGSQGYGIAVDGAGNAYVMGNAFSSDFPATPGAFDTSFNGGVDAFAVKLNPAGSGLAYATFLGGNSGDYGHGIAVDGAGSAYVTGNTSSSDFPATPGAFDTSFNGAIDAFVVKLNPAGSGLAYATFLGGNSEDHGYGIAVDRTGSVYATGHTYSSNFPTTAGAFDTSFNDGFDAFAVKLNPAGSGLAYATFLGGNSGDYGYGIAVDGAGSAYVIGRTGSSTFPTTPGAFLTHYHGDGADVFIVKLNPTGSGLAYATLLGHQSYDYGYGIAVDRTGSVYATGHTYSSGFPTTPGAFDSSFNDSPYLDAFVVKLNPAGSGLAYATFLGGSAGDFGYGIAVDAVGSAYVTGITSSSDFPTTPGAFDTSFNGVCDAFVVKLAMGGEAGYAVSGRVTDAGGNSISGATVSAGAGSSATTDGNGAYTLSGLAAGTYTLTPSKSGYTFSPASRTVTVPPDAPRQDFVATPATVTIDAVEVTQGIQCLNDDDCFGATHTSWCTTADCTNAVPLVVNKPTFVRLYVRSQQGGTYVTALLKGYYQNGQDLPGSPLLSPSVISAHVDGGDHGNADDSLNFRLPAAWTLQDNITLEPRLYLAGGGSSVDSRQLALAFSDRNAMPVFSWRFRFPTVAAATDTEIRTATQFAAQTYPISAGAVDLRDQGEFATNARNWSRLTAELAKSCNDAKRRSGYSEARCYGWVPQGVTIQSSDGHTYYGWTANGVSVGYVYRPPLAGGVENLAPQYIFAHEIGHTFGPVAHVATAACGGAGGGPFETEFPNTAGSIGQYGFYDGQVYQPAVVLPDHPTSYFDLMSYCGVNSNRQWISPYTYRHLFDALGSPDLARAISAPATSQPYLVVSGVITPTVTAAINSIYSEEYPTGSYDGQGSGPYRLELQDSQGAVLFTRYFDQSSPEWPDPTTAPVNFFEILPFSAGTAKLVVKLDTASLAEVAASANAPQVTLLEPAPGPVTGETLQVAWTADDADDDALTFAVEYSTDNGATWQTLAFDQSETSLTVKTADLPGSSQAKVRVLASDGFNTAIAESGVLEVPVKAPHVTIVAPAQGALLTPGQPVHLSGIAEDCEDGSLDGSAVTWTLDGSTTIGSGTQLTLLDPPAGQHAITFTAQDSTGSTASTGVDVFVGLQETTFPVSIAVAAPNVTLVWDHTTAPITGYSVYRSTNPYFMLGSDDAQLMAQITPPGLGGQVAYTDNTAFDSLSTFYAYAVCGGYGGDLCAMRSPSTGVFNFALTPGTLP